MTPQDVARTKEMMSALNDMIERRERGVEHQASSAAECPAADADRGLLRARPDRGDGGLAVLSGARCAAAAALREEARVPKAAETEAAAAEKAALKAAAAAERAAQKEARAAEKAAAAAAKKAAGGGKKKDNK